MKIQIGDQVRDMTADELAQHKTDLETERDRTKTETDKATAKQVLLDRLGITADEAALLLN
jgi:histidinol phosphatase-like enzyme